MITFHKNITASLPSKLQNVFYNPSPRHFPDPNPPFIRTSTRENPHHEIDRAHQSLSNSHSPVRTPSTHLHLLHCVPPTNQHHDLQGTPRTRHLDIALPLLPNPLQLPPKALLPKHDLRILLSASFKGLRCFGLRKETCSECSNSVWEI